MNREIKFRAWDKQENRMIVHEQDFIPLKVTNIGVLRLDATSAEEKWTLVGRDRFELMQYTGLKDKNGKEIYEDDLVDGFCRPFQVVWNKQSAKYVLMSPSGTIYPDLVENGLEHHVVIGNIYDNKELITHESNSSIQSNPDEQQKET